MAKFYEGQPFRQVLSMSGYFFSRPLGLVIFVRDCPFILVLNAPFRPKGLPKFLLALHLHYFFLFAHFFLKLLEHTMDVPMDNRDRTNSLRVIVKRAPPKCLESKNMTDSHSLECLEFPSMFLDYFELHLRGDNATTILGMDTDMDLSKSSDYQSKRRPISKHESTAITQRRAQ